MQYAICTYTCEAEASTATTPSPTGAPQTENLLNSEKGEVLLRGVGTLRYDFQPNASVQWQPGDLTIHTNKWFLGAGFLGAPPISFRKPGRALGATKAAVLDDSSEVRAFDQRRRAHICIMYVGL